MFDFLAKPLGIFLNFIYQNIAGQNYGVAIILFTLAMKLVLLPTAIKQQKVAMKMNEIQPQLEDIQRKYKNDTEKLNIELMKVYKENNVNPMGGCLPLFIQMPILIALYSVIARPLTYMLGYTATQIKELATQLGFVGASSVEIEIVKAMPEIINMFFPTKSFGINLGDVPAVVKSISLWIIPIMAAFTTYLATRIVTPKTGKKAEVSAAVQTQNSMMIVFPIMTGIFSYQLPAGLGLYWIVSNVFQILQQLFLKRLKQKEKEASNK